MPNQNQISRPTMKSISSYVKKHAPQVEEAQRHQHEASETVREADYEGHHIVVRTTYQIEVDGVPVTGHLGVTDDGQVHYHPIPNMSFASALDMVRQLIDVFPDDFVDKGGMPAGHDGHEGHGAPGRSRTKSAPKTHRTRKTHNNHE
ncbi:hypothetical protein [Nitrosospira sp. NRS527]|uniref:hypothetical protein n=1 Tax=Nitrosospira sp. NRS527 TaxID=155925 RepID=UPI001AFAC54E|nr:hypothetical protein [Nitrosospira sp. NRS527]BCT67961.1 hypothetical protein NNRS527_01553 [Nitrosospira sp. NRS527]